MKRLIKILLIIVVILAFLYGITHLFIVIKGKSILTKQLENSTKKKVSIAYLGIIPPLNLEVKNLEIQGLAKIDSISISPSILGLLIGRVALNNIKIVRPEFVYERVLSDTAEAPPTATPPTQPQRKSPLRLIVKRINIKDGKINFIDRTVGQEGIKITVKDINFNLTNLYMFPRSVIANFELKGKIPWQEGQEEGKLEAEGWLNFFEKDMQATLKIEDIDGIYLYPYYSNWVDLEKARIEKAKLNFTSNIQGLNNDVTAQCRLELTDIVRKPRPPEEGQEKAEKITDVVLDILKGLDQGKIVLNFTIKTKMDSPQFGFGDIKSAFEDKIAQGRKTNGFQPQDILMLPGKMIETTVKNATDISKAVIEGTVAIGKAVIVDPFKKQKKE